eukprot:GILJ01004391.1.p1 GENE.GILJ01004391.1~~GILJ01004391.1.p1  ORF type:complete len:305 (-),score=33.12 GILJ01004391.1:160-1074(-)
MASAGTFNDSLERAQELFVLRKFDESLSIVLKQLTAFEQLTAGKANDHVCDRGYQCGCIAPVTLLVQILYESGRAAEVSTVLQNYYERPEMEVPFDVLCVWVNCLVAAGHMREAESVLKSYVRATHWVLESRTVNKNDTTNHPHPPVSPMIKGARPPVKSPSGNALHRAQSGVAIDLEAPGYSLTTLEFECVMELLIFRVVLPLRGAEQAKRLLSSDHRLSKEKKQTMLEILERRRVADSLATPAPVGSPAESTAVVPESAGQSPLSSLPFGRYLPYIGAGLAALAAVYFIARRRRVKATIVKA